MKTDGGRGGCAAVCNAGMHNPKSGCTIFASPASASHCNSVHLILYHSASHCITVHLTATQFISVQLSTSSASHYCASPSSAPGRDKQLWQPGPGALGELGELRSMRWRLFFAHRVILMEVDGL